MSSTDEPYSGPMIRNLEEQNLKPDNSKPTDLKGPGYFKSENQSAYLVARYHMRPHPRPLETISGTITRIDPDDGSAIIEFSKDGRTLLRKVAASLLESASGDAAQLGDRFAIISQRYANKVITSFEYIGPGTRKLDDEFLSGLDGLYPDGKKPGP